MAVKKQKEQIKASENEKRLRENSHLGADLDEVVN